MISKQFTNIYNGALTVIDGEDAAAFVITPETIQEGEAVLVAAGTTQGAFVLIERRSADEMKHGAGAYRVQPIAYGEALWCGVGTTEALDIEDANELLRFFIKHAQRKSVGRRWVLREYKGRELVPGQLVKVHRNLNKNTYSALDAASGLVVAHADSLALTDVRFVVQEKGRQKVLSDRRKSVHAYAVGTYAGDASSIFDACAVTYNPYTCETFVDESGEAVHGAESASFNPFGVYCSGIK